MIIANPIYDVVFKKIMENERVAKFFIGTILGKQIESINVQPQEFTYTNKRDFSEVALFRLDFIATIKTEAGELIKTLIEVQTSFKKTDMIRFRQYLGEQYVRKDIVDNEETVLPITTIYVLGFNLPEFESPCVKIGRTYTDLITEKVINKKSDFAEKLTHESYIVQVQRITGSYHTKLEMLLSVFEQSNFVEDKKTVKMFLHPTDTEELRILTNILHHSGTDPEERKQLEVEEEAWRTINFMFGNQSEELYKTIEVKVKEIEKNKQVIEEKEQVIEEKNKVIDEKDRVIEEKEREILAIKKSMAEMAKQLKDSNDNTDL